MSSTASSGAAARARGRFGEDLAARWYVRHGYEVLDRNWRCEHGEIDLVLRRAGEVVFCEVKARRTAGFGGPQAAVGRAKQARLRRLAIAWLADRRPDRVEVRFDVAAVVGGQIEVIEQAF